MSSEEDIQKRKAKDQTEPAADEKLTEEHRADQEPAEPESAEPESSADTASAAAPAQPVVRVRTWPGTVALLLALVAIAGTSWMAYQQAVTGAEQDQASQTLMLEEQAAVISALQASIEEGERRDEDLTTSQQSLDAEVQRLQERSDGREAQLGELAQGLGRVDERSLGMTRTMEQVAQASTDQTAELADLRRRLEAAIEQMDAAGDLQREIDRDLRRQMLLLEAAGLLRTGQDMAELQGDWQAARRAFERARDRLGLVDDPRLEPVRQALAREIDALDAIGGPDLNAELAQLERLGRESSAWPMQLQMPLASEAPQDESAERGWRERLGQTFGAMVQVERRDALGRDEEQFETAREKVQLRLLAAELALVRRDKPALDGQIEAILRLINEWFQTDAAEVEAARAGLEALMEIELQPSPPELGSALDQLQTRLSDS